MSTRKVLMVAPHFPPDSGAATHRVRLLAPHLPRYGWEPTILTVDPRVNGGTLDPDLAAMVPATLPVHKAPAWSPRWTTKLGFGDLGLRALTGLNSTASRLLDAEKFDALFITIFPTYPALLGPSLRRRFGVAFVLDYIDPWVGEWGRSVGSGPDGSPDWKSRLTRQLGVLLEPRVVRAADGITAVSSGTYEAIQERVPELRDTPCAAIPYGGEHADFEHLRKTRRANPFFDRNDGLFHLCYVGTLLPLGYETLRAFFAGVRQLKEEEPEAFGRLRIHFFGTSNQTAGNPPPRATPVAAEHGLHDSVIEHPRRVGYLDALQVHADASAILLMGSTEHHYTASKLYPALFASRPLLAIYHERSSVTSIMQRVTRPPSAYLITYADDERAGSRVAGICAAMRGLITNPEPSVRWDPDALEEFSGRAMAGKLADLLDRAVSHRKRVARSEGMAD